MSNSEFDIVIPVGPHDVNIISNQLVYTKKNIIGYRNIYLITCDNTLQIKGCITVSEDIFPFLKKTVLDYHPWLKNNKQGAGWYLQQLLKLYAGIIIPNMLDRYHVIDADTIFIKPTTFVENNKCLYNYGSEYHMPYFVHMKKLHETLLKMDRTKSGICHHMMFETKYVKELINIVEKKHNKLFYDIFLENVIKNQQSGASEYEMYFNYMLKYHKDKIKIRHLSFRNVSSFNSNYDYDYDYVSYHWVNRN